MWDVSECEQALAYVTRLQMLKRTVDTEIERALEAVRMLELLEDVARRRPVARVIDDELLELDLVPPCH